MKKTLILLFVLSTILSNSQNTGDTIVVKAFKYGSARRDTAINFPNNSTTYERIIMKYNMRCKNGLISTSANRNLGCGEWDYSCNTYIADSSRMEPEAATHPEYIISNFSGTTFYYSNFPVYDYYLYSQTGLTLNSIISETQFTVAAGTNTISTLLKTNEKSGKTHLLYTAAELSSAGFTAGNINGIMLDVANSGGKASFFQLGIQTTTLSALSSASVVSTGFNNVYNTDYTFMNGNNRIMFHTPFNWNGTDNILIEYSFTNSTPSTPILLNGIATATVQSLYTNNNYAVDLENNGRISLNTAALSGIANEMTVSFWAYGNASLMPANTSVLYGYANDSTQRMLNIHLPWSNNGVYFDCGYSNGGFDRINQTGTSALAGGKWNHWAFTKNITTGTMKIYQNGFLWSSGASKTKPITLLKLILGMDADGNNNYKGKINQLSIWNKELLLNDVRDLMNKPLTSSHPLYSNLLAFYKCNEGIGSNINDTKNSAVSIGTNFYWPYERGNKISRYFSEANEKPSIIFLRGSYSITTNTISAKDSIPRNPSVVKQYSITSNATVTPMMSDAITLVSTTSLYNASPSKIYNGDTGTLTGTVAASPTGTITITNLNYTRRHPYYIELMSFVTPYGIGLDFGMNGKTWYFDVTDYAPLLNGRKRFLMTLGGEWQEQMDIDFLFIVGTPPRNVLDCYQLWQGGARWGGSSIASINNDTRYTTTTITANSNAKAFKMRSTITGHGGEGEFGQNGGYINHYFNINGGPNEFIWKITRFCAANPIFPQGGTWVYERQGWCPGEYSLLKEYDITTHVTPGSTVTLDYNCSNPPVPTGDYRYIAAHQLISYGNPNHQLDAAIKEVRRPGNYVAYSRENPMCDNPLIVVQNTGSTAISSLDIDYWINNSSTKESYTWNGNLTFMDTVSIKLPIGSLWLNGLTPGNNKLNVELKKANGSADNYSYNNKISSVFNLPDVITDSLTVEILTNNMPLENSYKILDVNNNVVPGASSLTAPNTVYTDNYILNGCYRLIMEDNGEDGLQWWASPSQGAGSIKLKNAQGVVIKTFEPDFGSKFEYSFSTKPYAYVSVKENSLNTTVSIHPNPAHDKLFVNLKDSENTSVKITDMLGREINLPYTLEKGIYTFNTSSLKAGMYLVHISKNDEHITKKVIVE